MKKIKLYFKTLVTLTLIVFVMVSCEKSIDVSDEILEISEEENITLIESNDINNEVDDIIDEIVFEEFDIAGKAEVSKNDILYRDKSPNCLEKIVVSEEINEETRIRTKTIILDFGDGCKMKNKRVLSGKITMVLEKNLDTEEKIVTHTYEEGFMVDDVSVSGTSTITRIRENGNPQRIVSFNKTLIWPDGKKVTRIGVKTREWIEGYNNNGWGDNVHLIWGEWETTFYNEDGITPTATFSTVISDENPLRREFSCKYIVSGIKTIDKGDIKGSVDFGDGDCDNIATFTPDGGEPVEFTLRKRRH